MKLAPGPDGPSRTRVLLLNAALAAGAVVVWVAARSRRVAIGDLERQPIGPSDLERLDSPPELEGY